MTDEFLLDRYLAGDPPDDAQVRRLIASRAVFPCYFGAALSLEGVQAFVDGLARFTEVRSIRRRLVHASLRSRTMSRAHA